MVATIDQKRTNDVQRLLTGAYPQQKSISELLRDDAFQAAMEALKQSRSHLTERDFASLAAWLIAPYLYSSVISLVEEELIKAMARINE